MSTRTLLADGIRGVWAARHALRTLTLLEAIPHVDRPHYREALPIGPIGAEDYWEAASWMESTAWTMDGKVYSVEFDEGDIYLVQRTDAEGEEV